MINQYSSGDCHNLTPNTLTPQTLSDNRGVSTRFRASHPIEALLQNKATRFPTMQRTIHI